MSQSILHLHVSEEIHTLSVDVSSLRNFSHILTRIGNFLKCSPRALNIYDWNENGNERKCVKDWNDWNAWIDRVYDNTLTLCVLVTVTDSPPVAPTPSYTLDSLNEVTFHEDTHLIENIKSAVEVVTRVGESVLSISIMSALDMDLESVKEVLTTINTLCPELVCLTVNIKIRELAQQFFEAKEVQLHFIS